MTNEQDPVTLADELEKALPLLEDLKTGQDCEDYAFAKGKGFQAMTYCPEAFDALKHLPAAIEALRTQHRRDEGDDFIDERRASIRKGARRGIKGFALSTDAADDAGELDPAGDGETRIINGEQVLVRDADARTPDDVVERNFNRMQQVAAHFSKALNRIANKEADPELLAAG